MCGFRSSPRIWLAAALMLAMTAGVANGQIPNITSNGSLGPISWGDGYYTIIFNTDAMTIDISTFHGGYSVGGGCPFGMYTGPGDPDGCARLVSQPGGPDIVVYDFTTVAIYQNNVYVLGSRPAAIAATGSILIAGAVTASNGSAGAPSPLTCPQPSGPCGAGRSGSGAGGGGGGVGPGWFVTMPGDIYLPLAGGGGGGGGGAWPGGVGANSQTLIDKYGVSNYLVGGVAGLSYMLGYGPVVAGSGGGSGGDRPMWGGPATYGGAAGGNGGGALILATPGNLTVSGTLSVAGSQGGASNDGGGGGGGGGGFLVLEVGGNLDLQSTGILTAAGGAGGVGPGGQMNDSYGGRGAGGVIHIDAATITKAGTMDVSGANPGLVMQTYNIGGTRYIQSGGIETLAVPFTAVDGAISSGNYHGFVRLNVSGSGVSCTPATNDAFYIYEWLSGCSSPNVVPEHDPNYYQLTFNTTTLVVPTPSRTATRFINYDIDGSGEVLSRPYVPAYRADHTYSFVVDTGVVSPAALHFGVSDGGFGDNSGAYQVRITQLEVAYPLTLLGAGNGSGTVTTQAGLAPLLDCAITIGAASGLCSELYPSGTSVTLTAVPGAGSGFTGWSGACTGTGTCIVTMNLVRNVTATFDQKAGGDFNGDGKADILWRNASTGENLIWYMNGVTRTGGAYLTTLADLNWAIVGTGDFTGDGKADILWRNASTGEDLIWFMNGVAHTGEAYLATVSDLSWTIVGTGDFTGDGKPDILWRNVSTGENYVWYMDGVTRTGGANLTTEADLNWKAVGTGDFNRDGKPDILWRNTWTGENAVWYMDGVTRTGVASLETRADRNWSIAMVADFTGDGKPDLLWRNTATGQNEIWALNGVSHVSDAAMDTVSDLAWEILQGSNSHTTGRTVPSDFTGDGKPDILWRNVSTGENYLWYMNGVTRTGGAYLTTLADLNWTIVGTGDFTGDGKPDILWRNASTGENLIWYMNGVARTGEAYLTTVTDLNWTIVGTADFTGDGKPDILWRNMSTGDNYVWFMDGVTRTGGEYLTTVADRNWTIVGTGDFTGDGKPDILWRNMSTGDNYVWFMDGVMRTGGEYLTTVADRNWSIAMVADFTGDGKPDILWRNTSTGENYVWYMDGVTRTGGDYLTTVADRNWGIF
jgi:hypothetical protein